MNEKIEIGFSGTPLTIKYYATSVSPVEERPLQTVSSTFDMHQWHHGFRVSEEISKQLTDADVELLNHYGKKSLATEQKIAIIPMPAGCEGYETVAVERIPRGSLLLYSSEVFSTAPPHLTDGEYAVLVQSDTPDQCNVSLTLDAKFWGNISRFMSHAYDLDTLHQELGFFSDDLACNVATANFKGIPVKLSNNNIFLALVAFRDIAPRERLYWDYSKQFFQEKTMHLFMQDAHALIDPSLYYPKNPYVYFEIEGVSHNIFGCVNDFLQRINDPICQLAAKTIGKPYDVYILPEFIDEFLQRHPLVFTTLRANEPLVIPLPSEEHPCVKRLFPGYSLNDYLIGCANRVMKSVYTLQSLRMVSVSTVEGPECSIFCTIQPETDDQLSDISNGLDQDEIPYILDGNTIYCLRDGLFKHGASQVALDMPSSLRENSFFSPGCRVPMEKNAQKGFGL